jgi:hypothetical protein
MYNQEHFTLQNPKGLKILEQIQIKSKSKSKPTGSKPQRIGFVASLRLSFLRSPYGLLKNPTKNDLLLFNYVFS